MIPVVEGLGALLVKRGFFFSPSAGLGGVFLVKREPPDRSRHEGHNFVGEYAIGHFGQGAGPEGEVFRWKVGATGQGWIGQAKQGSECD